jgi:hypothetical protein
VDLTVLSPLARGVQLMLVRLHLVLGIIHLEFQFETPNLTVFFTLLPYFEKINYAYVITLLSVCVYIIPPIVARQRLGKNPLIIVRQLFGKNTLIVARQRLDRNVTAVTNTPATVEELLDALFSMWPVSYQGKLIPPLLGNGSIEMLPR